MASTKGVSFRIPLKDYADLINNAKKQNLSISDYIISKIYSSSNSESKYSDDDYEELVVELVEKKKIIENYEKLISLIEDSGEINVDVYRNIAASLIDF